MFTSEIVCLLASQFTMKSQTMQVSGMFSVVNGTITTNQYSDPTKGRQKPAEFYQMKISFKSSNKYSRVWYLGIACKLLTSPVYAIIAHVDIDAKICLFIPMNVNVGFKEDTHRHLD